MEITILPVARIRQPVSVTGHRGAVTCAGEEFGPVLGPVYVRYMMDFLPVHTPWCR